MYVEPPRSHACAADRWEIQVTSTDLLDFQTTRTSFFEEVPSVNSLLNRILIRLRPRRVRLQLDLERILLPYFMVAHGSENHYFVIALKRTKRRKSRYKKLSLIPKRTELFVRWGFQSSHSSQTRKKSCMNSFISAWMCSKGSWR